MALTHSELCQLAVKWLRMRKQQNCYPWMSRCNVVASEIRSWNYEIPDAIGWSCSGSILIECKTSVADFKNEKKKYLGRMGNYRLFLTEKGLLDGFDLGEWGLIEIEDGKPYLKSRPTFCDANDGAENRLLLSIIRNPNRKGIWLK